MKYELFVKLYGEALEYVDVDLYIAERGWQDWMDDFENPGQILKSIYNLASMSVKDMRESKGFSRASFSRAYKIPLRSLENWDADVNKAPDYVKMMIAYTFLEVEQMAKPLDLTGQTFGY